MSNKGKKKSFPSFKVKVLRYSFKIKFHFVHITGVNLYKTDAPASFQTVSTYADPSIFDLFFSVIFLNLKCMI